MEEQNLLVIKNVSQSFGVGDDTINVLKNISFNIPRNSFTVVFGKSGSGKSTLLNILSGLQKPTTGSVVFDGVDILSYKPDERAYFRANKIGFVYQQNFWVKSLNVVENVAMPMYFYGYSRAQARPIVMQALERVGMANYAKKYPSFLSGGEQQRIAVARAIVNDPMMIIADEPTGSLDTKNGDLIMSILKNARDEFKHTVVLVTHNVEYLPMADNMVHIVDGQITVSSKNEIAATTAKLLQEQRDRVSQMTGKGGLLDAAKQGAESTKPVQG